jgi:hypothetical protein
MLALLVWDVVPFLVACREQLINYVRRRHNVCIVGNQRAHYLLLSLIPINLA